MADNEERIAVVPFKGDFLRTQADWKHEGKYPACRLRNVYGISRAEAVERMAKAVCMRAMYGCERCIFGKDKEKCEEWIAFKHIRDAEAALDALLGENK